MKYLLLSNVNMQPLLARLKPVAAECGAYNSLLADLSAAGSAAAEPDVTHVLCLFDTDTMMAEAFYGSGVPEQCDMFLEALEGFCRGHPEKVVVANTFCLSSRRSLGFADLTHRNSLKSAENALNSRLVSLAKANGNLLIFDMELLFRRYGEEALLSTAIWYAGRIRYTAQMFDLLATTLRQLLSAYTQACRKVLVVDADNTLWGGLVGELGANGVALGEDGSGRCYRDFQKSLKALERIGVLLAVASKNEQADVEEILDENPAMILRREDFAAIVANWEPKAENIVKIAEALNLGTDSFVFIDDNPVERDLIRKFLPDVAVPEFPDRVENLQNWFMREVAPVYFGKYAIMVEDEAKTEQYRANTARQKLAASFDLDSYLRELNIECNIQVDAAGHIARAAQMTQKTNQFNLTTRRYDVTDLARFIDSTEHAVLMLDYRDRFGDEGSVGLAIVDFGKGRIDTFLASCRVIGRKVETRLLEKAVEICRDRGLRKVIGEYIPSRKNKMVASFYEDHGFRPLGTSPDGGVSYEKSIDTR